MNLSLQSLGVKRQSIHSRDRGDVLFHSVFEVFIIIITECFRGLSKYVVAEQMRANDEQEEDFAPRNPARQEYRVSMTER